MKKWIVVLALLLFQDAGSQGSASCDIEVTWERPYTRLDGSILPLEEIEKYTIYVNLNKSTEEKSLVRIEDILDAELSSWILTDIHKGRVYIYMTATDIYGISSAYSDMLDIVC